MCGAMVLVLSGCAGSAPNAVLSYQPGDEKRSCTSLKAEIGQNVALGITGIFLIVPWFFMDVKGKEAVELSALRHRNRNLRQFAANKEECTVPKSKVKFEEKEEEKEKKSEEK